MITEHALLQVKPQQAYAFEADFRQAAPLLSRSKGYISHQLGKCLEIPGTYLLLVQWSTLEDHTEGFRKHPDYLLWKSLLHRYYDPLPEVTHYSAIQ
ncbi:MAG TPA: antibiotic biosynthesis monooxygenase [Arachidicoccus sp.]|nr:antibiotic biosynthesis monooxygenase [Arachidicoccus sp.]